VPGDDALNSLLALGERSMERPITADGTDVFYVTPGRYVFCFDGSPAVGTTVLLKGSNGVQITDSNGDNVQIASGALPEPVEIACAGNMQLVTSSYSGSSNLVARFRRIPTA